ncbi:MAG: hypothetical protein ACYC61_21625 [Isosphaeraceae bacterium]
MAAFGEFVTRLLEEGRIVLGTSPPRAEPPTDRDAAVLAAAFATHALAVAGPPIAFDPRMAIESAELVRQAAWALVDHRETPASLQRRLRMARDPSSASHHLSADLFLRYLPQVLKRARALDPTDPLVDILAEILRRWPLSGALSDVEEPPITSLALDGHPGLLLLYAERLAAGDRPGWRPDPSSPPYPFVELLNDRPDTPTSSPTGSNSIR